MHTYLYMCVCVDGNVNAVCGSVPQSVHCVSMASGEHRQRFWRWTNQSLILLVDELCHPREFT